MENSPPLITLSGPPASGTTTLGGMLAEEFHFEVLNGGAVFRKMAAERELSLSKFTELAEDNSEIDNELDQRLKKNIDAHLEGRRELDGEGLIVESRLAGWHADRRADLSIWLDAPAELRASRLSKRTETPSELRQREKSDAIRYERYYGIDITDLSIYDLVVDTGTLPEDCMFRTVKTALECVKES